jgi:dipeptidyl aminopeptidase/acylaminoacyl peptidase
MNRTTAGVLIACAMALSSGGCTAPAAPVSPPPAPEPATAAAAAAPPRADAAPTPQAPFGTAEQMQQMRHMFVGRRPELDSMRRWPAELGLEWERFEGVNPGGVRIVGWWLPAKNPTATIVMVHGGRQNKSSMLGRAAALVPEGFNVAVIDLRARGESGGDESELGPEAGADVIAAANALVAGRLHRDLPLIGYGFSHGARTVLFAAAQSRLFDMIVAEAPPFSIAAGLQRQLGLPQPPPLPEGNLAGAFAALSGRPVLLLVGDADPELSEQQARTFLEGNTVGTSAVVVFPQTGHGVFSPANSAPYTAAVSQFVRSNAK